MKKNIIIGIVIFLIITLTAFVLLKKDKAINDSQKYLTQIVFDSSGGMNGSVYNVSLDIKENIITVKEKDFYDEPYKVKVYKVTKEEVDNLKVLIAENNFPAWEKYKMDETLFAYDAASDNIMFEYEQNDLEWYNVNLNIKITREQRKKLNEFVKLFLGLIKEEDLIEESISED